MFEIDGRESDGFGYGDRRRFETLALPRLRCRMIDFEDPQPVEEIATVSIGIQSCAEDHKLTDSPLNRRVQSVLGKARADGDENSHSPARGMLRGIENRALGVATKNSYRQGILKNAALFQNLMSSAVRSSTPGRAAWQSFLHEENLSKVEPCAKFIPQMKFGTFTDDGQRFGLGGSTESAARANIKLSLFTAPKSVGNIVRLRALCDGCSRTPPGPEGSNGNEPLRVPQITRSLVRFILDFRFWILD